MAHDVTVTEETLHIPVGKTLLEGDLALPHDMHGLVLFAHGSGSSRKSPRNIFVARALHKRSLGTLLFDLLTADEERIDAIDAHLRFDIPLLAERLAAATRFVHRDPRTRDQSIGYFGASTGAAAALIAAAQQPALVRAVVSRGGRPDLAGATLSEVHAPTLLIVGGDDTPVIALNQQALGKLSGVKRLAIVPGATHLFEEPGTLEEVALLAADWLVRHLGESKGHANGAGKRAPRSASGG